MIASGYGLLFEWTQEMEMSWCEGGTAGAVANRALEPQGSSGNLSSALGFPLEDGHAHRTLVVGSPGLCKAQEIPDQLTNTAVDALTSIISDSA